MKHISKLFEAWATYLRASPLLVVRLKWTAYYAIGLVLLLIIFNIFAYWLFALDFSQTVEQAVARTGQERAIDQTEILLRTVLFITDGLSVLILLAMGYYLAKRTLAPIEASYQQQHKLVADAAHELRTPLTVMKTGAESVLKGKSTKDDLKGIVKDSLEEVNHLVSTVNNLLFLADAAAAAKEPFSKLDLAELAERQVRFMQPRAAETRVSLRHQVDRAIYVLGDRACLKRLLTNLIQNALTYNKPGGSVIVSLRKHGTHVELKVTDTGIGIAAEDLRHIFDRFYKANNSRDGQSGSAGLGLSIVQEIVAFHNGEITIESKLGEGTVAKVLLPAA